MVSEIYETNYSANISFKGNSQFREMVLEISERNDSANISF